VFEKEWTRDFIPFLLYLFLDECEFDQLLLRGRSEVRVEERGGGDPIILNPLSQVNPALLLHRKNIFLEGKLEAPVLFFPPPLQNQRKTEFTLSLHLFQEYLFYPIFS
jgi:hypothetical protein